MKVSIKERTIVIDDYTFQPNLSVVCEIKIPLSPMIAEELRTKEYFDIIYQELGKAVFEEIDKTISEHK